MTNSMKFAADSNDVCTEQRGLVKRPDSKTSTAHHSIKIINNFKLNAILNRGYSLFYAKIRHRDKCKASPSEIAIAA